MTILTFLYLQLARLSSNGQTQSSGPRKPDMIQQEAGQRKPLK